MREPLVTVAIPTYNRAVLLAEALSSALGQSLHDLRVLVSDNASGDATEEVVRDLGDPRVTYHRHDRNRGFLDNWVFALTTPETRYVAFLADDDLYLPHHVEAAVSSLEANPEASLYACAAESFGEAPQGLIRPWWLSDAVTTTCTRPRERFSPWLRQSPAAPCAAVIRRSALASVRCWRAPGWAAFTDWILLGQLALAGSFVFEPRVGVRYRRHPGAASDEWCRGTTLALSTRSSMRLLARIGFEEGVVSPDELEREALGWPPHDVAHLILGLSAPGVPGPLQGVARRLFLSRADLGRSGSRHIRLARRLGPWYLRHADRLDRLRSRTHPST